MESFNLTDILYLARNPLYLEEDLVTIVEKTHNGGRELHGDIQERALQIKEAVKQGYTIFFRGLERYIPSKAKCLMEIYGENINIHAILAAQGGPSFGIHRDLRDVTLINILGMKMVLLEGDPKFLSEGNSIHIPAGTLHQVRNLTQTFAISVGVPNDKYLIEPKESLSSEDLAIFQSAKNP